MKLKLMIIALVIGVTSCNDPGYTRLRLQGNETNLPEELKGLKVYTVAIDNGRYIEVAIMGDKINSTTYQSGKNTQSIVILNKQDNKLIEVSSVLMENDSLIICGK
jgi:hypothetical protein